MATVIAEMPMLTHEEAIGDARVWVKRNRSHMWIYDMVDDHLLNAIAMLERGQDADGRAVGSTLKSNKYDSLIREALRRKILDNDGWDL